MTEEKTYDFKTRKEAQKALDNAREKSLGFCPETAQECRKDCVCYQAGSFSSYQQGVESEKKWRICRPYCAHVNIAGVITAFSG